MNCDKHSQSECRNQHEWKQIVGLHNVENKKRIQKQTTNKIYLQFHKTFFPVGYNLYFTRHFHCSIMSFDEDMTPIVFTYCIVLCNHLFLVFSLNLKMSAKRLISTAHQLNIFESFRIWTWNMWHIKQIKKAEIKLPGSGTHLAGTLLTKHLTSAVGIC